MHDLGLTPGLTVQVLKVIARHKAPQTYLFLNWFLATGER